MELLWLELLRSFGVPAGFVLGLGWMLASGRLVTAREHEHCRADRDRWLKIALRAVRAAEEVGEVVASEEDG